MTNQKEKTEFDKVYESVFGTDEGRKKYLCSFFGCDESISDEDLVLRGEEEIKKLEKTLEELRLLIQAERLKGPKSNDL